MKGELVSLAKEKEFIGKYHLGDCFPIEDYDFSNLENHWYLWMCELQKWLREKHEIYLSVVSTNKTAHRYFFNEDYDSIYPIWYKSYEDALEEGLKQGLKLLK